MADAASLRQEIHDVWRPQHPVLDGQLHLVNTSAGKWHTTPGCSQPQLLLLLSGHYRTFSWTAPLLEETMRLSSNGCSFAAAALPIEIDGVPGSPQYMPWVNHEYSGPEPVRSSYSVLWAKLNPGPESLSGRMAWYVRQVSDRVFNSRLAFAVMRRVGDYDRWPGALAVGWHTSWAVAMWAAKHHGWRLAADVVIVRARPDVLLRTPFAIGGLQRYFRFGPLGEHLMLSANVKEGAHWYAQSDYFAITSLGAWTADVALPLALAGRQNRTDLFHRGFLNGWGGFGASVRHISAKGLNSPSTESQRASMAPGTECECLPLPRDSSSLYDGVRHLAARPMATGEDRDNHKRFKRSYPGKSTHECPESHMASCWMLQVEPALILPIGVHRDRPGGTALPLVSGTASREDAPTYRCALTEPVLFVSHRMHT